jgi:hypothetical protein
MTEQSTLGGVVAALIEALRRHAATMTADAEPTTVIPVINEVRTAAFAYVNAVFDQTGWGNVFANLEDEDEDDDDDLAKFVVEDGVERLSLTGRWDFLVRDAAALQAYTADRLRAAYGGASPDSIDQHSIDQHSDTPGDALESLVAMDVGKYPGLEGAGGGWEVGPIEKTLFEMTPAERRSVDW